MDQLQSAHSQVTINTATGLFDGYAWGENIGWIHFKNTSPAYNVVTTWSNASSTSSTDKYAWSENSGWVNFNSTHSSVTVYSSYLEGYAWAENIGWIKLGNSAGGPYNNTSSGDWGVNNNGSGNLSGYAWSENVGWINFNPPIAR